MAKNFKLLGNVIEITNERDKYNQIRLKFSELAEEACEEFKELYKKNNHSLDDVSKYALNQGNGIIGRKITEIVQEFVSMGFYNIDEAQFIEKYYEIYYIYEDYYNEINDKYMDIVLTEEQKDEYRNLRKQNRGRWQGGGFGFEGAIKGATKAGMLNVASGAMHGVVNMGGKLVSSISASNKKNKVFRDSETLKTLVNGIYYSVFDMHLAYINFMIDNCNLRVSVITEENEKEAQVILNNITSKEINKQHIEELIRKVIDLDPYNCDLYRVMIDKYGDMNLEIERIAKYFGINIEDYKLYIVENLYKTFSLSTEKEALREKEMLLLKLKELGLRKNNEYINNINNILNEFDEQERTVEDILFDTREEAEKARKEIEVIKNILSEIDEDDEKGLIEAYSKINKMKLQTKLAHRYILMMEEMIKEFDVKKRTVDGFIFESIDIANKARKEADTIKKMMVNISDNKQDLIKIKNDIEKIKFETTIGEKYISIIDSKITEVHEKDKSSASELTNNKDEIKSSIIGLIVVAGVGGYFFPRVGTFWRVVIGILILGGIFAVKDAMKKVKESKKAIKRLEINE